MRCWISLIAAIIVMGRPALAANDDGQFLTGGGVGSVSCPQFMDRMASARLAGGLDTGQGVQIINPFMQYVLGFRTGYNLGAPKIVDVFASMPQDTGSKSLIFIESWCSKHPEETFDFGLFELLKTLKDNSKSR